MRDRVILALSAIALVLAACLAVAVAGGSQGAVSGILPSDGQTVDEYYLENGAVRERLTPDDILAYARENGGFTYNPLYGATPKRGYALALQDHGEVHEIGTVTGGELQKYMQENGEEMVNPAQYIGGWVNDGKLYLDISIVLPDEKEAREAGRMNDQISIFDLGTNETIYLKGPDGRWLVDAGGNWLTATEAPPLAAA